MAVCPDGRRLNIVPIRRKAVSLSLAAKDTLRTDLSISDEMVPSIVAEDGIVLRVYCWLAKA